MNKVYLAAAAALLLATTVTEPANAANESLEGMSQEMLTPAKKTKKKTTTKKKSTSKKTTTTQKKTTTTPAESSTAAEAVDNSSTEATQNNGSAVSTILGGLLGGSSSGKSSGKSSTAASVLGGLLGGGSSSSSSDNSSSTSGLGGIISGLSTIFDASKTATADNIVGTWTYEEPAVVFESDNVLKNLGGKVASATIEKKLQSEFSKVGLKKGAMQMTFDKDGNFTQTMGSKKLSGTYTISGKSVKLNYGGTMQQLLGTTQLDGNDLLIVMDASKLLKYAGAIGKLTGNSTISTLSSLLGSYDGMEIGLKLQKES